MPWRELMRFLNCYVRRDINREHTSPMLIGQPQTEHAAERRSSTICELAQRYREFPQLCRIKLLAGTAEHLNQTDGLFNPVESRGTVLRTEHHRLDPVMVSARRINEALVFLSSLFHPCNWLALDLF